ncbi:MAG TPA: hypothetical protein VD927_00440 [Chryseosolibacter sp.]|nr:hypothetical protein [Chryseosolibacter sp.]
MTESIKELTLLLRENPDIVASATMIGLISFLVKNFIENPKFVMYFITPQSKKISRLSRHLEIARSIGDEAGCLILKDLLEDAIFNFNTGLSFRGVARVKFLDLYPRIRCLITTYELRLIRYNITIENDTLVVRSKRAIMVTDIIFYFYFGSLFTVLLGILWIHQASGSVLSVFLTMLLWMLLLIVAYFILNKLVITHLTNRFRTQLKSLQRKT